MDSNRSVCPKGSVSVFVVEDLEDGLGKVLGLLSVEDGPAITSTQDIGVGVGLSIGLDFLLYLFDQGVHFDLAGLLQLLLFELQLLAHKLATLLQLSVFLLGLLLGETFGLGLELLKVQLEGLGNTVPFSGHGIGLDLEPGL